MRSSRQVWAFSALLLLCLPSTIRAQSVAVAQVSGSVLDPTGKAIAGARVSMTETSKGQVRTTDSDGQGNYLLAGLPVGPYRLEVAATGFKDYVQSGLV